MDLGILCALAISASLFAGALAGITLDRMIVSFPAWRRVGVDGWAAYSRKADLGNGLFLYPFLAVGHTLLALVLLVGVSRADLHGAFPAAWITCGLGVAGLIATIKAAPFMLALRHAGDDRERLLHAYRGFARWSTVRAAPQALMFPSTLWLLVRLYS